MMPATYCEIGRKQIKDEIRTSILKYKQATNFRSQIQSQISTRFQIWKSNEAEQELQGKSD